MRLKAFLYFLNFFFFVLLKVVFFLFCLFCATMTYWLSSSIVQIVSESYRYLNHFTSLRCYFPNNITSSPRNQAWQKHAMSVLFFLTARWLTQYSLPLTLLACTLDYCITFCYISNSLILLQFTIPFTPIQWYESSCLCRGSLQCIFR